MGCVNLLLLEDNDLASIETQLTDSKIKETLKTFKLRKITPDIIEKVKVKTKSEYFTPDFIKNTNLHGSYFCRWVLAVVELYES